uniref:Secreted protein n=1 Tax=Cucumis melo TaxID=3656 RepID=A0A9I9CEF1_CUCME
MVKTPKKRIVWTIIALPLVVKLPNSTIREFPGNWKSRPGERRMKRSNPNRTGAQSNIASVRFRLRRRRRGVQ